MNSISRIIEPPTTDQQTQALHKYKKYMLNGISPFLACISTIPAFVVEAQWEWLQVIDLWWWKWDFCTLMKEKLPKVDVVCIDTSIIWNTQSNKWVQMIWDTLLNTQKYINTNHRYILVTCIDTIHHLDNPQDFFDLVKNFPPHIWLYIKDYIRPVDYEELRTKMNMLSTCIYLVCKQDISTAKHVVTLSKQSLLAALWKEEIMWYSNNIPWITYKETNSNITYEIIRNIHI